MDERTTNEKFVADMLERAKNEKKETKILLTNDVDIETVETRLKEIQEKALKERKKF